MVGVVRRVKYVGLDAPDEGTVYSPLNPYSLQRFIVIRTQADPATTMSEARQVVRALDPSAPAVEHGDG